MEMQNMLFGSAKKVREYFESNPDNTYGVDKKDIPLMQVAIAYHEYEEERKGKVDREQIGKLCEEYGYTGDFERVVQISTILKDADALDRERFGTRGKLNEEYLRTNSAKSRQMILFAQKVNGIYAQKMLDKNYKAEVGDKVNVFEAVRKLQKMRKSNGFREKTLSVDEMLELFAEARNEYTRAPNDVEKKKNVIRATSEMQITSTEIQKAEQMVGIHNREEKVIPK